MKKILSQILIGYLFFLVFSINVSAETVIAIDPGHGGSNSGADYLVEINSNVLEKDLTLELGLFLKEALERDGGIEVLLLRDSDTELSLKERAEQAAESKADFLISLHFNASELHQYYGSEIWISGHGKNYADSYALGQNIEEELIRIGLNSRGIKTRLNHSNTADYYGIIREGTEREINTIIIEHCFVDNQYDEKFWSTSESIKKLAEADTKGIISYLNSDRSSDSLGNSSEWIFPDITPPEIRNISLQRGTEGAVIANLNVKDSESRLSYYTYSFDEGESWHDLLPLLQNDCTLEIVPDAIARNIKFRVYNGYDLYSESDLLEIPSADNPSEPGRTDLYLMDSMNYEGVIYRCCYIILVVLLGVLTVCETVWWISILRKWWTMRFYCFGSKMLVIKMQEGAVDTTIDLWKIFSINAEKKEALLNYTKLRSICCQTGIENMCLSQNELHMLCRKHILRTAENKDIPEEDLRIILNQLSSFDYIIDNCSSVITPDMLQILYQTLTANLKQEKKLKKDFFVKLAGNLQMLSAKKNCLLMNLNYSMTDLVYCEDDFDCLLEIFNSTVHELGINNRVSYAFAGLMVFKECVCNQIPPIFVDSQAAHEIISGSLNCMDKKSALHKLFCEGQAEFIRSALILASGN